MFASGKDRDEEELHAGFALSAGEELLLVRDGDVVDAMESLPDLGHDAAFGAVGRVLTDASTVYRTRPSESGNWTAPVFNDADWTPSTGSLGVPGTETGDVLDERLGDLLSWWSLSLIHI